MRTLLLPASFVIRPRRGNGSPQIHISFGARAKAEAIALLLILLMALALRLYRLDAQSLWADEGNSLALAGRSLPVIARDAASDIHPPLYYFLLHFWTSALGTTEFTARSLSALVGTALVALTYLLGRRLLNRKTGLLAAFLAAISPFQIHYSQEARMYMLASLLGAISVLAFLMALEGMEKGKSALLPLCLWVATSGLGLYTHYSFPVVIALENVVYLAWLLRAPPGLRRGRAVLAWALAQTLAVLLYLPWLPIAYRRLTAWPTPARPLSTPSASLAALRLLSLGHCSQHLTWALPGFALLVLLGLRPFESRKRRLAEYLLLLLYLFAPFLMMLAFSLFKPAYFKFLLISSPAFCLVLGRGAIIPFGRPEGVKRPLVMAWSLAVLAFLTASSAFSLYGYYFDPRCARDDYRGIARYIEAAAGAQDAVLLNAPGQYEIFAYYYRGDLPIYPLPRQRPLDPEETTRELEAMARQHRRLFAVLWATDESDPQRLVEGWLDAHAYKALDTWYGNVRLAVYAFPKEARTGVQHPLRVQLGDSISLLGYTLLSEAVEAGDVLQLTLFWQTSAPLNERYKVFVHLLDPGGHVIGQRDAEPGGGARLTTTWEPGEVITDNYGLLVPPGTPPGTYPLEIGMYSLESGQRLSITREKEMVGDRLLLPPVTVLRPPVPPPLGALQIQHLQRMDCGPLELLGYDLYKMGFEHQDVPIGPGDPVHLTLYWRAKTEAPPRVELVLRLEGKGGRLWLEKRGPPLEGRYPMSLWSEGEVIRDDHYLFLPPELPKGAYRFILLVNDSSGQTLLSHVLATFRFR